MNGKLEGPEEDHDIGEWDERACSSNSSAAVEDDLLLLV
jgi:hypothetical protein